MRRDGGAEVAAAWERVAGHTYAMHHCQRGWEFKARKGKGRERSEMASEPTIRYSMCPDGRCFFCPLKRGRCAYNVSRSADHGTVCLSIDQVRINKVVNWRVGTTAQVNYLGRNLGLFSLLRPSSSNST